MLKPQEIYRALEQCEEHSSQTLERGLLSIERSANKFPFGILPEIHFFLARSWFSLHQAVAKERDQAIQALQQQMQEEQLKSQQQMHTTSSQSNISATISQSQTASGSNTSLGSSTISQAATNIPTPSQGIHHLSQNVETPSANVPAQSWNFYTDGHPSVNIFQQPIVNPDQHIQPFVYHPASLAVNPSFNAYPIGSTYPVMYYPPFVPVQHSHLFPSVSQPQVPIIHASQARPQVSVPSNQLSNPYMITHPQLQVFQFFNHNYIDYEHLYIDHGQLFRSDYFLYV